MRLWPYSHNWALVQSILTLDGYHVAQDWVIGLFYDEASQAGQGALSHRIRLDEIETALAQQLQQLEAVEQQLPEPCSNRLKRCNRIFSNSRTA